MIDCWNMNNAIHISHDYGAESDHIGVSSSSFPDDDHVTLWTNGNRQIGLREGEYDLFFEVAKDDEE